MQQWKHLAEQRIGPRSAWPAQLLRQRARQLESRSNSPTAVTFTRARRRAGSCVVRSTISVPPNKKDTREREIGCPLLIFPARGKFCNRLPTELFADVP